MKKQSVTVKAAKIGAIATIVAAVLGALILVFLSEKDNSKNTLHSDERNIEIFNLGYNCYLLGYLSQTARDIPNYEKAVEELEEKIRNSCSKADISYSKSAQNPEGFKQIKKQLSEEKDKRFLELGLNIAIIETMHYSFPHLDSEYIDIGLKKYEGILNEIKLLFVELNIDDTMLKSFEIKKSSEINIIKDYNIDDLISKIKGEIRKSP